MTTTKLALLALLALAGCRLPDTYGVGYLTGSFDGTSTASLAGSGFADSLDVETDLEAEAVLLSVSWSLGYPVARRNEDRLERLERSITALRSELAARSGAVWSGAPASDRVHAGPDPQLPQRTTMEDPDKNPPPAATDDPPADPPADPDAAAAAKAEAKAQAKSEKSEEPPAEEWAPKAKGKCTYNYMMSGGQRRAPIATIRKVHKSKGAATLVDLEVEIPERGSVGNPAIFERVPPYTPPSPTNPSEGTPAGYGPPPA